MRNYPSAWPSNTPGRAAAMAEEDLRLLCGAGVSERVTV